MRRKETSALSPSEASAAASASATGSDAEDRPGGIDRVSSSAGPARSTSETMTNSDLEGDLRELDFTVHVSLKYHSKRRAFLENAHRWAMLLAVIGGSAAFVAIFGDVTR